MAGEDTFNGYEGPMVARGNLTYIEFIRLIKEMWAEAHPDIPIFPTQGRQHTKIPCIIYGLQDRRTHSDEPKRRHREEKAINNNQTIITYGQRYQNTIKFSVLAEDPELADAIIEMFEDFMDKYTPIFKRSGISEFLYARREPDDEHTRTASDICVRTVAYLVTIEKLYHMDFERIQAITISARAFLNNLGENFEVTGGNQYLTMQTHDFEIGNLVIVKNAAYGALPAGLNNNWIYKVSDIDENDVYLEYVAGGTVTLSSNGLGRLLLYYNGTINIETEIRDYNTSATPDT